MLSYNMACCTQLDHLMDRDLVKNAQPHQLSNRTIITDIDTEFFLVFGEDRHQFKELSYCRSAAGCSRELWNLEKKSKRRRRLRSEKQTLRVAAADFGAGRIVEEREFIEARGDLAVLFGGVAEHAPDVRSGPKAP